MLTPLAKINQMKKITIIILLNSPFDLQNYNRTGIPVLRKYFRVVVLDFTNWLASNINKVAFKKHDYEAVETVNNGEELVNIINKLKPTHALDYLGNVNDKLKIIEIIKRASVKYVVQRLAPIVDMPVPQKILSSIFRNPMRILDRLFIKLFEDSKPFSGSSPDLAIVAGSKYLDNFTIKSKVIINAGSEDYFTYKTCKECSVKVEVNSGEPYILFIDDCIAESDDYLLNNTSNKIDQQLYYKLLDELLEKIELVSGLSVIVAAHPNGKRNSSYRKNFGNREVHFGLTAQLSEQCALALTHYSTAISFPILWRKPIIIITVKTLSDDMNIYLFIKSIIYYLKCPSLPIDAKQIDVKAVYFQNNNYNKEAYNDYINRFIKKHNVVEEYFYEQFISYVKKTNQIN
jgi:hypothetical protein